MTTMWLTILLNRTLPNAWLREHVRDSRFSRFRWPRWVDYSYDEERWQRHMTRAEWRAWARAHMPNGQCICYPERGIVCGQHESR